MSENLKLSALSPELAETACNICKEKPEENDEYISTIQTWIKKSPHLKAPNNEFLLLSFLRRCSFSMEDTKRRIDSYYSLRDHFPEVLRDRQMNESLLSLFKTGIHVIPEKPITPTGPRVVISQYNKVDPKKSNPREAFKLLFMLLEILALEDHNASISGIVVVVDARNLSIEQMLQYDPTVLKKSYTLVDECLPLKFVEVHIINMRPETRSVFSFVTSVLPVKMSFKITVHSKAEHLYEHIPRDAMTVEYGGHNGYHNEALHIWEEKLLSYKTYFEKDSVYGTNEKLRIGKYNYRWNMDDLNGLSGSFRKLEVD